MQISDELSMGAGALGLAIGVSRGSGATASASLGRLTDRIGAVWSIRLALAIAAVSACGICWTAVGVKSLIAWLLLAGWANAVGQPAVNRLLARVVKPDRLGLGFGVKQSAPPAALLVAGVCVPVLALTVGWRWSFGLVAAAATGMVLVVGRRPEDASARRSSTLPSRLSLRETGVFVVAFALGTAASSVATAFYVSWAVDAGTPPSAAGLLLALASLAAIIARLAMGWASDRMARGHLRLCAVMLLTGAAGFGLLATGDIRIGAVGIVVALAGAWGFNGVFWYALVRAHPSVPGAITGALAPGGLAGAALGPLGFGLLVHGVGYRFAWITALLVAAAAATAMRVGARKL